MKGSLPFIHDEGGIRPAAGFGTLPSEPQASRVTIPSGHVATYRCDGGGMIDHYDCSCGWTSGPFFDGEPFAKRKWERHFAEAASDSDRSASATKPAAERGSAVGESAGPQGIAPEKSAWTEGRPHG